jgi:hypothetical protein
MGTRGVEKSVGGQKNDEGEEGEKRRSRSELES